MGAQVFITDTYGSTAVREAFHIAREEALMAYGNRGYTGTIAEKDEFRIITNTPMSHEEAVAKAEQMIEDRDYRVDDKWGPAGAIPIGSVGKPKQISGWLFFGVASS